MSERRYSDDEVALILRKATEAGAPSGRSRDGDGMTLEELQGIGREVGIAPAAIAAAARHVAMVRIQETGGLLGASATPRYEVTVPGKASPEKLGDAVAVVRRAMGRQGLVRAEFGGLEWQARDMLGGRYVSLQPGADGTHIRVFGNFRDGAFLTGVASGVPSGAVASAIAAAVLKTMGLATLLGAGTLPVGIVAGVATARFVWKRLAARETRALEQAAADLEWALGGGGEGGAGGDGAADAGDDGGTGEPGA
jgi:hypothetical protein